MFDCMLDYSRPAARIANATKYPGCALGDSFTYNGSTGVTLAEFFPFLLQTALQGTACAVAISNQGVSGDTTGQVLVRARLLPTVTTGSIGVLYAGTNDLNHLSTVQASPSPTSTVFAVAAGLGQWFPANTSILVNGISRVVLSVSVDTITLASALPGAPTAGQAVSLDTTQNLIDAGNAMISAGYTRLIVCIMHYLNFSSGGDTLQAQQSDAAITRAAQTAAIASLSPATADFYTYMRNLIVNGTVVQGSFTWQVADMNSHLNAYGESLLNACLLAAIPAAWLPALRI